MAQRFQPPPPSWFRKFARAMSGMVWAARTQNSCYVHAVVSLLVIAAGFFFGVTANEWCVLLLAMSGVWCAELLNTAIEELAKLVDANQNRELGRALDVASGGVLCMALGAAAVGLIVLGPYLWAFCFGAK